jgi:CRISPR type IV-associated protein Csf3
MQIIHRPELDEIGDRFQSLPKRPLRITLKTLQSIAGNDSLHLDGLLAKAVEIETGQGKSLPRTADAYWIPLPLGLERTHNGLPLWQCNDFRSVESRTDHTHYHQRSDCNPYDLPATYATLGRKKPRRMPPISEGQYMSYRIPIQRTVSDCWMTDCIGNKDEILRLLSYLPFVGKKGSQGYGRVLTWQIEESSSFELKDRPIPIQSAEDILITGSAHFMGWTPPYWHRGLWSLCTMILHEPKTREPLFHE